MPARTAWQTKSWCAIGTSKDAFARLEALVKSDVDVVFIDTPTDIPWA
jgi:hypothetical protein